MNYTELIIGLLAGSAPSIIPIFSRTKKDSDQVLFELVKVLRTEIDRVRAQVEDTEKELAQVKESYVKLQNEYDTLLKKYNQLKNDFINYKNKKNDFSNN